MATLYETANYIRCKNAGPFVVTFDIFCDGIEQYEKIKNSPNFNAKLISQTYGVKEDDVKFFFLPELYIIKFSIPRVHVQGSRYDQDMHQCQQVILLHDVEL